MSVVASEITDLGRCRRFRFCRLVVDESSLLSDDDDDDESSGSSGSSGALGSVLIAVSCVIVFVVVVVVVSIGSMALDAVVVPIETCDAIDGLFRLCNKLVICS